MDDTYVINEDNSVNDSQGTLDFKVSESGKPIISIKPNGEIHWNPPGKEATIIEDSGTLGIALLDVVVALTDHNYDYSKLSPKIWENYQEFIETYKGDEN